MIRIEYEDQRETYFIPEEGLLLYQRTGSNYICDPPVITTDFDVLILVKDREEYRAILFEKGWIGCSGYEDKEEYFFSAKYNNCNLIVTDNRQWYMKFAAATELAKAMNVQDKDLRIELFSMVLDVTPL